MSQRIDCWARVTIAFMKSPGTKPSDKEQFTNFVIDGRRMPKHSLTRYVGQGVQQARFCGRLCDNSMNFFIRDMLKSQTSRRLRYMSLKRFNI